MWVNQQSGGEAVNAYYAVYLFIYFYVILFCRCSESESESEILV